MLEVKDVSLNGVRAEVAPVTERSDTNTSRLGQRSYAELRDMLVAKDAPLWRKDAKMALVAAMSLPSSQFSVQYLLNDLRVITFPLEIAQEKLLVPCRVLHRGCVTGHCTPTRSTSAEDVKTSDSTRRNTSTFPS